VVVDNDYVVRIAISPGKTDPPLVIDADAMLAGSIPAELLQAIAWRDAKIVERFCRIDRDEFPEHGPARLGRVAANGLAGKEAFGVAIAEAPDHTRTLSRHVSNVKRYYVASQRLKLSCG
jgi:hypothetical protein